MLDKVYWLLEILSVIVLLHSFGNKKLKFNIWNVGYIFFEVFAMVIMADNIVSKNMFFIIYIFYFGYAIVELERSIKDSIVCALLSVVTAGVIQMLLYIPLQYLYLITENEDVVMLLINVILVLFVITTHRKKAYRRVAEICTGRAWIVRLTLMLCISLFGYCMYIIKLNRIIVTDIFVISFICLVMFMIVVFKVQRIIYENKKVKEKLEISQVYNEAFRELINVTRRKQHDLHNHIDAIFAMHLVADDMETLIEMQREYCDRLVEENRYADILSSIDNSVMGGFVYSKFLKFETDNIQIDYDISYRKDKKYEVYDLIEIVGILLDNAYEAVAKECGKFEFIMKNIVGEFVIETRNPLYGKEVQTVINNIVRGRSIKGSERGVGFKKIREFQKKYKFECMIQGIEKEQEQWISIKILDQLEEKG